MKLQNTIRAQMECLKLLNKQVRAELTVKLYASLRCYRLVTDGPSVNPMDYIFSSKPFFGLMIKPITKLYAATSTNKTLRSLPDIYHDTLRASRMVIMAAESESDTDRHTTTAFVTQLHQKIDTFLATMPKEHDRAIHQQAFIWIEESSLSNRAKSWMDVSGND